eukprot:UN10706
MKEFMKMTSETLFNTVELFHERVKRFKFLIFLWKTETKWFFKFKRSFLLFFRFFL